MTASKIPYRRKPSTKPCTIEGCHRPFVAKGFCKTHYGRVTRLGSPDKVLHRRSTGATYEEKFWRTVAVTANPDKCWNWLGYKKSGGYGQFVWGKKHWLAHRYSFFLTDGREPSLHVLHSCDNPSCVNPKHLREGTDADNANDKKSRGRNRWFNRELREQTK